MKNNKIEDELDNQLYSYDYEIDSSLIAYKPRKIRHKSRLMIVKNPLLSENYTHNKLTEDLVDEINEGDLVIVNDTKVMKARLNVELENRSIVELLVIEQKNDSVWLCLGKPARKLRINTYVKLGNKKGDLITLKVVGIDEVTGGRLISFPSRINDLISMNNFLDEFGSIPLPPYIKPNEELTFHERCYQTQYAKNPGAVAAPTAGLHISEEIISRLKEKGVKILAITLHVGYGTFKPIEQNDLNNLTLHKEYVNVKKEVIEEIKIAKKDGRKVIAIGTTSVRALESCFCSIRNDLIPINKNIDLVIKPGYRFRVVDSLLTNFHLPKSSLLLLVSAMIGRERLLTLYKFAMKEKFRFFSYGDAMFIKSEAFLQNSGVKP